MFSRKVERVPFASISEITLACCSVSRRAPSGAAMGPSVPRSPWVTTRTLVPAATTPGMLGATVSVGLNVSAPWPKLKVHRSINDVAKSAVRDRMALLEVNRACPSERTHDTRSPSARSNPGASNVGGFVFLRSENLKSDV